MKRGRGQASFPPKFYSRKQELIFCKPDWIVWRAYHYKSAKSLIRHPVRVQRGLVTRLGTSVVVSRVSGGDYQFSGPVCIKSRRDLECRILGGFREGFLLPRVNIFAGCRASVVGHLEVFQNCLGICFVQRGDFRLKLGEWFTSVKTSSEPEFRVRAYCGCVVADQENIVKLENLFRS
jgi:hypothetical protein